jgi:hypothetical protein
MSFARAVKGITGERVCWEVNLIGADHRDLKRLVFRSPGDVLAMAERGGAFLDPTKRDEAEAAICSTEGRGIIELHLSSEQFARLLLSED